MNVIPKATETALPPLATGWQLVTTAVLEDGKLGLLAADADLAHEWRRGPDLQVLGNPWDVAARATAKVWSFDGEALIEGPAFPLETPFPKMDRFDDGRWLIVASRTDNKPNARVLAPDGTCLARIMLGDGIEHVGVDRHAEVWVGWFDEGVFGNDAWRVPGEEWSPSSRGVGRFSADGDYRPLPVFPESTSIVADCYALNIDDDGAWACVYCDFPLLHLRPDAPVRWWSNAVAGGKALAVSGGYALFAGGYGEKANQLVLAALEGNGNGEPVRVVTTGCLPLDRHVPQPGEPSHIAEHHRGNIRRFSPDEATRSIWFRATPGIVGAYRTLSHPHNQRGQSDYWSEGL